MEAFMPIVNSLLTYCRLLPADFVASDRVWTWKTKLLMPWSRAGSRLERHLVPWSGCWETAFWRSTERRLCRSMCRHCSGTSASCHGWPHSRIIPSILLPLYGAANLNFTNLEFVSHSTVTFFLQSFGWFPLSGGGSNHFSWSCLGA